MKMFIYAEPSEENPNFPDVYNSSMSFDCEKKCRRMAARERNSAALAVWEFTQVGNPYLKDNEYKKLS